MSQAVTAAGSHPNIAIILNAITPYRVALHLRVAREIPEVRLWTLYTHGTPDQPWTTAPAPEINPVEFGEHDDVEQQSAPKWALREFFKAGRIIRWLVANRVRAVFLSGYSDLGRLRIFRWCSKNDVPIFLLADSNIYCDRARGLKKTLKSIIVKQVVRWCAGVMPFGSAGARYYHRYGAVSARIAYFPQEPDYGAIETMDSDEIRHTTSEFHLSPQRRRFVYCGRFQTVKRPDLAIRAFVRATDQFPDWDLVLIGDGPLMATCLSLVPAGLKHRVLFTGFLGDQRQITGIYRLCDVLVVPSDSDAWGLVVNEATCAGLAIIASEVVGAVPELVHPGVNGLVVPKDDEAELASAMAGISQDSVRLEAMKQASRRILHDWRVAGDPIKGMRAALSLARVLET